ncbi:hypothetical protein [Pedobacter rhodius]|uniref:Uncharacterized protein n=1 Tax=Pedobacter rhodius TaxID=3004098 RepID=A0ABT4KVW3_9SPHI|nr:hypothetical protein [Pedobacter sp. SJ11]MCZ4223072.1 hypothetical protein [Pedobacter sp. SJ11]
MKEVNRNTTAWELENIREGDTISLHNGKCGEVVKIQIIPCKGQKQYFYKLKNDGTIFIIK